MSRKTLGVRLVCATIAGVALGVPAFAQSTQPRGGPFSGLFNGSPKEQPHTLDVRGSTFAAWDDNLLAQSPNGAGDNPFNTDPRFIKPGLANGFQGAASYGFRTTGTRSAFNLGANGSIQEFASAIGGDPFWFHSYDVTTGLRTNITNKTSIHFGAGSSYAPFYQYAPFLKSTTGDDSPVGSDYGYAVNSTLVRSTSASIQLDNRFSKRSSFFGGVSWDRRDMSDSAIGNMDNRSAQIGFSHNLTRKLAFHVGYTIQESHNRFTPDAKPTRTNMMDVGLGYGDGLTLTFGKQTLTMSIGASLAKNGDPVSVATTGKATQFVVSGGATLSRPLGRTWSTSVGYARGTSYVVGFSQPIMSDSASAGIGGPLFTQRLNFSAGAGAMRGQQLFIGESGGSLVSYSSSLRLTYALFSHLGLYSQASYYRFSIPSGFTNFGFVPDLDRRSVSAGLSAWLPLIKQRRERKNPGPPAPTGQP